MSTKPALHYIDPSSRSRAEFARLAFGLGHHCEVYGTLDELADHPPRSGIIIARDGEGERSVGAILERLAALGVSLPLIAVDDEPRSDQIVTAIKAGALDYLALPFDPSALEECLARVSDEIEAYCEARRRMIEARSRIANLSNREREVLDWLAQGSSNKTIARELEISPRTVEIHRANMMTKLGATHPADAVRLKLEARL